MSSAAELSARYAPELKGFGASLPDDLTLGLSGLTGRYDEAQLEQWLQAGIALANHSLRSWEAASEYFRASPAVAQRLTFEELQHWVALASELAGESSLMAAAFIKATPAALKQLSAVELDNWSAQGGRLCRGNWKSIALSGLYFQRSPRLLGSLPLASVGRLVDVIDQLTERSYELANSVLEGGHATVFRARSEVVGGRGDEPAVNVSGIGVEGDDGRGAAGISAVRGRSAVADTD
jgi:hypothetical protein